MYQPKVRSKLSYLTDYTEELFPFHVMKWIQDSFLPVKNAVLQNHFFVPFFLRTYVFKILTWKTSLNPF